MKHITQKGFTLVEMVAVLGIFSILTTVVLFNYAKFRSETILTNMAYEVALSIRESQIYGVSARSSNSGQTADFTRAYGIFIPQIPTNAYYLFSDTSDLEDKKFTGTDCITGADSCITPYVLQQNIQISEVRTDDCNSTIDQFSVLFKRPNPEPIFSSNGQDPDETISMIQITLRASDGAQRYVLVANNGQISVVNEPKCQ